MSEGQHSPEYEKLKRINRFGLEAITGRKVFLLREFIQMISAENIVTAYQSRKQSQNWAAWAHENPKPAELLAEAEQLYANSFG